jgi:hypothetical protein
MSVSVNNQVVKMANLHRGWIAACRRGRGRGRGHAKIFTACLSCDPTLIRLHDDGSDRCPHRR